MLRRVLGEHIELAVQPSPDPIPLVADKGQIEQVLLNLCLNARDAMPGGGRIEIRVGKRELRESDTGMDVKPGDYLELTIRDTGDGMSSEVMAHLFEPFYTTKALGKGTGMGLAVVYGIVRQHGGDIRVQSKLGVGTEFVILLPLDREASSVPPAVFPAIDLPRGHGTLLYAEDDAEVRDIGVQILERAGYHVFSAADGLDAITVIDQHHAEIRLAILDVIMPRRNGREVYDHIKKHYPKIAVLFLSGYSADMLPPEIAPDVGTALLGKPYSDQELLRLVHRMMPQ